MAIGNGSGDGDRRHGFMSSPIHLGGIQTPFGGR